MKVAIFATCIGDVMFPGAVQATASVLTRLGCDVTFPPTQTCCGQMHVNTGYQREVLPQLDRYADAFLDRSIDYVVAPSGSCAGAVRDQHPFLARRHGTGGAVRDNFASISRLERVPRILRAGCGRPGGCCIDTI